MKWLLILLLSLLGIAMGYLTLLPVNLRVEQIIWLIVFLVSAFFIFRYTEGRYFLHGFLVGIIDCIMVMMVHVFYYSKYLANHADIAMVNAKLEAGMDLKVALIIIEASKGLLYALTSGIFAIVMSAGLKKLYE